jgi:YidC/Oxa1 family membrane protein insertase
MDNKRFILALALSFAVFVGWQMLFPQPAPKSNAPVQEQAAQQAQGEAPAPINPLAGENGEQGTPSPQDFVPTAGKDIHVETPLFQATFNTSGGVLERFVLRNYHEGIEAGSKQVDLIGAKSVSKGPLGVIIRRRGSENHTWLNGKWAYEGAEQISIGEGEKHVLVFKGRAAGFELERRLTIHSDSYLITEALTMVNLEERGTEAGVAFTAAAKSMTAEDNQYNPTRIAWLVNDGRSEEDDRETLQEEGVSAAGGLKWGAIESNYFIMSIVPNNPDASLFASVQNGIFRMAVDQSDTFQPGMSKTLETSYYLGPADRGLLASMPNNLDQAVNFGWFDPLAKPMLMALVFFNQYVNNYGMAIIILTIIIKVIFWPLSQKSYKSMDKMKQLQPMIQKLREKYGDDKQRLNQETMALYKTYKVNPASGCLPMLVQIPVFFGLYKALLGAIELRHAPFIEYLPGTDIVWLADLSAKDPLYITPIIMGATMFLQQKMTPSTGDPTQQKIMMFMPLVFTFLFLQFPAGLVVYWLMNNVLSIGQQWLITSKSSKKKAA